MHLFKPFVWSVCELVHKSSFQYLAESQGHMWAFLIGGFLTSLTITISYEPHDWPNFYVCVTVGRSDMSKFTEGSLRGSFTVNNERSVRTLKPSSEQKNALR